MKKIYLLLLSFVCLSVLSAFAGAPCDNERGYSKTWQGCQKPCEKPCQKSYSQPCEKSCAKPCAKPCEKDIAPVCAADCFLCTNKNADTLLSQMHLSNTQLCTAQKINEKYQLEVMSLNERLNCEYENRGALKRSCAKRSELRASKRIIKDLKKERKKICDCYEKQFKAILSDPQKKVYKKLKK